MENTQLELEEEGVQVKLINVSQERNEPQGDKHMFKFVTYDGRQRDLFDRDLTGTGTRLK